MGSITGRGDVGKIILEYAGALLVIHVPGGIHHHLGCPLRILKGKGHGQLGARGRAVQTDPLQAQGIQGQGEKMGIVMQVFARFGQGVRLAIAGRIQRHHREVLGQRLRHGQHRRGRQG